MSKEITIVLPKLGESIVSATIVQWFKKEGDDVALDEPLLEVSTDKVNSEIPSPVAGKLIRILASADEELQVGDPLAKISSVSALEKGVASDSPKETSVVASIPTTGEMRDFYSPAVLRVASELGVSLDEMKKISATGAGGRITKQDIESYSMKKTSVGALPPAPSCSKPAPCSMGSDIERLKMTGMRKAIADNMVKSFYQAPHATLVSEVDVSEVLKVIAQQKEPFLAKHGVKLTITSFVAKAISRALQEFPLINSSLDQDTILVKKFVNLGIAVSIDQGLIVPVIKNCQKLNIVEIAKAISDISVKARTGKLSPSDIADGTISMTNFGMSGVAIGIPIIRFPEVAIIGIGAIQRRVVALEGDLMAIRSLMHVSLTFDHRVLDGMYGCGFLAAVKKHLEHDLKLE
ncbi:MAG: dihydrolipoamide acetyltransferase family protein [Chlamydiae bacterium]|nr:dihydrolipoamide acetyltransferase family protein [Chlamydiota bacterium]